LSLSFRDFAFVRLIEESKESATTTNVTGFSLRFKRAGEAGESFVFGGGEGFGTPEFREELGVGRTVVVVELGIWGRKMAI